MTRTLPDDYPPILYIPCTREVSDPSELEVTHRTTKDGRSALLVYSALDRLKAACGSDQPWFVLPTVQLQLLWDAAPFDLVLLDLLVPEGERAAFRR